MGQYNPAIQHRRSIRLKNYDYSQLGAYFVTICTKQGMHLFGEIKDNQMVLSRQGEIAYNIWLTLPDRFPGIELDHFVVMPNHVHGIIVRTERLIPELQEARKVLTPPDQMNKMQLHRSSPYRSQMLCEIVRICKGATCYYARRSNEGAHGFDWHRDHFEHVIRNNEELNTMRTYIINNPANWQKDKLHPTSDWKLR